jgi:hypothetical protein
MSDFDPRTHVAALLSGLGRVLGQPDIALNEEDRCTVRDGGAVAIEVFFAEGQGLANLTLASIVGELDQGDRVPFLTELLRANLFWRGTEGATLSLGPDDDVLLHREIPVEESLTMPELRQAMDSLIEVTRAWRIYLEDHQPPLPDMA